MNNPVLMKSRNSTTSLFDTRNKTSKNSNKNKKSSINNDRNTKIHNEFGNDKEINSVYNPNINSKLISMKEEISKLISDSKTTEHRDSLKQLKQYQNNNIDCITTSKASLKASNINNFQSSEHHSDYLEHTRISSVNSLNLTSVLEQSKHIYSLNQVFSEVNVINTISDNNQLTILLKDLKVNSIISNKCSVFKLENSYMNKNNIVNEISIKDQSLVFVFYFFHSSPMIMYLSKNDIYSNISYDTGNLNTRCVVCYKENDNNKNNEAFTLRTKDNGNNIEKSNNNNNESDEYEINTCNCRSNNDHNENNNINKESSNNYFSKNIKYSLPTISSFSFQKDFSKSPAEDLLVSISFFSNSLDSKKEKLAYITYRNNLKDFYIKAKKRLISKLNNSTADVFNLFLKKRSMFNLLIKHNFIIFKKKIQLVKFKKQQTKIYFSSLISKITENILIKIKQMLKYRAFLLKTFFIYSKTKLKTKIEINSNILFQKTNKEKIERLRKTIIIRKLMRKKNKLKISFYNSKISNSVFDYLNKKKLFLVFKQNYINSKNKVDEVIINRQVRLFFHILVSYNNKCRMIKDKMTVLQNNKLSVEFVLELIMKIYIRRDGADCEDVDNNTLTNNNLKSMCISPTNIKSQINLYKRLPFKQQLLITESIKSKFIELLIMNSRKAKSQIEKFGNLVNKLIHRNNLLILKQNYLNYKNGVVIKKQIIKSISTQANLKLFTNKLILSTKLKQSYSYCFFILYNNCLNSYQFRQDLINKKNIIYYQLLRFRFFSFLSKLFIQKSNNKLISSKSLNYINRIKIKHYNTLNTKKDFIRKLILNDYYKKLSFINKQKVNFTITEKKTEILNLFKHNKNKKIMLLKKNSSFFIIKGCLERLCSNINNKLFTKQVTSELISAHQRSFNFSSVFRGLKKRVYEKKKMCVLKEKLRYGFYSNLFMKFLIKVNKEIVVCVNKNLNNINNVTNDHNCNNEEFIHDIKELNCDSISKKEDFLNSNLYSSLSNNYILLSSQFRFLNREAYSNSNRNNNIDNEINVNNTDYNNETNILNYNNININTQRTDNSKNNINQNNNLMQRLYLTTKNKLIASFNRQVLLKYSINKFKSNAEFNKTIITLNQRQAYSRIMTSFKSFLNITRLRVIKEYQKRFFSLLIIKNYKRSFFTRIEIKSGLISIKDDLKNKNELFLKKISVIIIRRNLLENKLNKLKHSILGNNNIRSNNKYDYYLSTDLNFISKTEKILYNNTNNNNNTNNSQDSSIINDNSVLNQNVTNTNDNYHDNLLPSLSNSVFNTKKDFFYLLKIVSFRMMIKKKQQVSFIVSILSYYQNQYVTKTKIQLTQWNSVMREFCGKVEKDIKEKKRIKNKNINNNSLSRISRISAENKDIDFAHKQSDISNSLSMNKELKDLRNNDNTNENNNDNNKRNIMKDTEDEVRREIVDIIERNLYNKRDDNDIDDKIEGNINNINDTSHDTLLSDNNKTPKNNLSCISNISNNNNNTNSQSSILKQKIREFKDYFLKENSIIDFFTITAKQIKQARKIFYFHLRFNSTRNAVLKIKKIHALHYVFKISKFLRKLNYFKLLKRNFSELQINNDVNDTLKNNIQAFLIKTHLLFIKEGIKAYKLYKKKKFANETRMKKNILDLLAKNRDYSKDLKGYLKEAEYVDNNIKYISDSKKEVIMESNYEIEKKINHGDEESRISNKCSQEENLDIREVDRDNNEENYLISTSKTKTRNKNLNNSKIVEPNVTNSSNNFVVNDDFLNNDENYTINTEEND